MIKEKPTKKLVIRKKRYTPIKGVFVFIIISIMLMIPFYNIYVLYEILLSEKKNPFKHGEFWKDCFWDYVYVEVKK